MKIEHLSQVSSLVKKRKEIKQDLLGPYGSLPPYKENYYLKITVEISDKEYFGSKSAVACGIRITEGEVERLFAMVKKYNEEEVRRVERDLNNLGVELESKNCCDNETVN